MNADQPLPSLRPLDVVPVAGGNGQPQFALQDNSRIAPRVLAVGVGGYFVLAHLDGRHTRAAIQAAFTRQFQQQLPAEQIDRLVAALDENLMLLTDRYEAAYQAAVADYLKQPVRDNRAAWPDGVTLANEIDGLLSEAPEVAPPALGGVVAPHLDYARGKPCYQAAYAQVRAAGPFERYVILGTNHGGRCASIVGTRKDFLTPLGLVATDRALLDALEAAVGAPLCADEYDHRWEHSVELQLHILQRIQPQHGFQVAAFLCPDVCGPTGLQPAEGNGPALDAFAAALDTVLAADDKRTLIIAGADLSHVGQRFGEEQPTDRGFLLRVEQQDRRLLKQLTARDEHAFVTDLAERGNPTRICSAGCIFTAVHALPDHACTLLDYHQAVDFDAETHVTCAALALDRAD